MPEFSFVRLGLTPLPSPLCLSPYLRLSFPPIPSLVLSRSLYPYPPTLSACVSLSPFHSLSPSLLLPSPSLPYSEYTHTRAYARTRSHRRSLCRCLVVTDDPYEVRVHAGTCTHRFRPWGTRLLCAPWTVAENDAACHRVATTTTATIAGRIVPPCTVRNAG